MIGNHEPTVRRIAMPEDDVASALPIALVTKLPECRIASRAEMLGSSFKRRRRPHEDFVFVLLDEHPAAGGR